MNQHARTIDADEEIVWPNMHQCKWIDGDPKVRGAWTWCLQPVQEAGAQYCPQHLELVYTPARPR